MPEIIGTEKRKGIAWRKTSNFDFNHQEEGWDSFLTSPPTALDREKPSLSDTMIYNCDQGPTYSSSVDRIVMLSQPKDLPYTSRRRRSDKTAVSSVLETPSPGKSIISLPEETLKMNKAWKRASTDNLQIQIPSGISKSLVLDVNVLKPSQYFPLKLYDQDPVTPDPDIIMEFSDTHSRSEKKMQTIPSSLSKEGDQICLNSTEECVKISSNLGPIPLSLSKEGDQIFLNSTEECAENSSGRAYNSSEHNRKNFDKVDAIDKTPDVETLHKDKVLQHISDETSLASKQCLIKEGSSYDRTVMACDVDSLPSALQSKASHNETKDKRYALDDDHELQAHDLHTIDYDFPTDTVDSLTQDFNLQIDKNNTPFSQNFLSFVETTDHKDLSKVSAGIKNLGTLGENILEHKSQTVKDSNNCNRIESDAIFSDVAKPLSSSKESKDKILNRLERRRQRRRLRRRKRVRPSNQKNNNEFDFKESEALDKPHTATPPIDTNRSFNESPKSADQYEKPRTRRRHSDSETEENDTSSEWKGRYSNGKRCKESDQSCSDINEISSSFPVQTLLSRVDRRRQRRRLRKRKRLRPSSHAKEVQREVDKVDRSFTALPSQKSETSLKVLSVPITLECNHPMTNEDIFQGSSLFHSFKNAIQRSGYIDQVLFRDTWSSLHCIRICEKFHPIMVTGTNDSSQTVQGKRFELSKSDALNVGQLKWEAALLDLINECQPKNNIFPRPVELCRDHDSFSLTVEMEHDITIFGTLAEFLQWHAYARNGMIPEPVIASLVLDIIEITKTLHRIGIAHNNLGLETFLVVTKGSRFSLILTGLGKKGRILSSEKITNHFHHDLFSVAFITWALLTGCVPFEFIATIESVNIEGMNFLSNNIFLKSRNEWKDLILMLMKISKSDTISMNRLQDCILNPLRNLIQDDKLKGRIDVQDLFRTFWNAVNSDVKNWEEISFTKSLSISSEEFIFNLQLQSEVSQPQRRTSAMQGGLLNIGNWLHSPVENNAPFSKERLVTDNDDDDDDDDANNNNINENADIKIRDMSITIETSAIDPLLGSPLTMQNPKAYVRKSLDLHDSFESCIDSSSFGSEIAPPKNPPKTRPKSVVESGCSLDYDAVSIDSVFERSRVINKNPGNTEMNCDSKHETEMIADTNSCFTEGNTESFDLESECQDSKSDYSVIREADMESHIGKELEIPKLSISSLKSDTCRDNEHSNVPSQDTTNFRSERKSRLKSTAGGLMDIFASITSNDWKRERKRVEKIVTFIPANQLGKYRGDR